MLVKTFEDFQSNSTQQLPYVKLVFRTSGHKSTSYPLFLVLGGEINLPTYFDYLSPDQLNETDMHQFFQPERVDMKRTL